MPPTTKLRDELAAAKKAQELRDEALRESNLQAQDAALKASMQEQSAVKFVPSSKLPKTQSKSLLEAYETTFGKKPDKDGVLSFPSRIVAIEFFKKLAEALELFLVTECRSGVPTGFHLFSCGDNTLYQGTYDQIKADLEDAVRKNPHNQATVDGLNLFLSMVPNPTQSSSNMRERMQDTRREAEEANAPKITPQATRR